MTSKQSLQTTHPQVAATWHPTLNGGLTPANVTHGSNIKRWWTCDLKHSYQRPVYLQTKGSPCPYCDNKRLLEGFNDLATKRPDLLSEWDYNLNTIDPATIRWTSVERVNWKCAAGHEWTNEIRHRAVYNNNCMKCANAKTLVIARKAQKSTSSAKPKSVSRPKKDIKQVMIEIVGKTKEGHTILNFSSKGDSEFIWSKNNVSDINKVFLTGKHLWVCKQGHEWEASIQSRLRDSNCLYCLNRQLMPGFNDLATVNPELAQELHPTKNGDITACNIVYSSKKKLWWVCKLYNNHEWEATLAYRSVRGDGCKICGNKIILPGYNDLATTRPEWAKELNPKLNSGLTAKEITRHSSKRIKWQCKDYKNHIWTIAPEKRAGCPVCSGTAVLKGFNDLGTQYPEIAKTWHPTKNGKLTPYQVTPGSVKGIWWVCPENSSHEWKTRPSHRVVGTGCSICSPRGFNLSRPSRFYFIKHEEYKAYKVGITDAVGTRLPSFQTAGWEIVKTYDHADGSIVQKIERTILNWVRKDLELPRYLGIEEMKQTGGWTETFSMDEVTEKTILDKIAQEWSQLILE